MFGRFISKHRKKSITATKSSLSLGTGDKPQFLGIEMGHATDTTIEKSGAGDISIESNKVYRVGGLDVAAADGGTGQSSYTVGDILYASGSTTLSKLGASTDGHVLTATGAGSAPAWEAAAGGSSMWNFSQGAASKCTNDKWSVAHTTYGFQIGYIWSPTNIGAAGLMTSPHASLATNLFPWIVIPYDVTITGYRYDFSPAWNGEAHSFCLMQGTAVANGEETVWSAFDSVQTLADSVIDTSYAFYTMERTGLSISMGKGTRLCPAVRSSDGDTSTRSSYYWLNIYGTKD